MNNADLTPLVLLLLFGVAFVVGFGMVLMVLRQPRARCGARRIRRREQEMSFEQNFESLYQKRPSSWLAIKSCSIEKVRAALEVQNPRPCPLAEGLAGDIGLFIAPPLKGWIVVTGSGLPNPAEDVDICYKFLTGLSEKLGEVQFFSANPVVQHHAWIRLVRGKVERAFAWAGETLWNQGRITNAEKTAGVVCPGYGEDFEKSFDTANDIPSANVEKVPLLALKWSLDPATLEAGAPNVGTGIAGDWRGLGN